MATGNCTDPKCRQLQLEKDQTGSVQFGPMYISVL